MKTGLPFLARVERMGVVLAATGDTVAVVSRTRDLSDWEARWIRQRVSATAAELQARTLITAALEEAKR